jgi:Raf kinase inhibitor-like YbhB/YbcL family protein
LFSNTIQIGSRKLKADLTIEILAWMHNHKVDVKMILKSENFVNGSDVPSEFTCDGENISPQLAWTDAPENTESFALSVADLDAPGGTFIHWLVYNIPKDRSGLEKGIVPEDAVQVTNDFGKKNYGGPCPPSGTHRYFFTIYALDVKITENITKNVFFDKIGEHTLEKAELTGLYRRR